jgi:hypothetical protein
MGSEELHITLVLYLAFAKHCVNHPTQLVVARLFSGRSPTGKSQFPKGGIAFVQQEMDRGPPSVKAKLREVGQRHFAGIWF